MTTTALETNKSALAEANPNKLPDAVRAIKLSEVLGRIEEEITIASSATVNLTTDAAAGSPLRRGALMIQSFRVKTGVAAGTRTVGTSDATPTTAIVAVNAAGTIITMEAAATVVVICAIPNPALFSATDAFSPIG